MQASRIHRRAGFTLMEIILVVVIAIIVASISIPLIQTQLAEARITASGDIVRGKMAEARARAMDEGRPWRFGFIAGSSIYQLAPDESSEWDNPGSEPDERADLVRDKLPQDIIFAFTREEIMGTDQAGSGSGSWNTAAVFLPDGSAVDDTTVYFGKAGSSPLRAKLRALTGIVNIESYKEAAQ